MAKDFTDEANISVLDAAFQRSQLPTLSAVDSVLGNEPWDAYVCHLIKLAGVTVELVNSPMYDDQSETLLACRLEVR